MQNIHFPFYLRLPLTLLSIVLILFLLYVGQGVFIPLFFAIYISFLLYPLAAFLERRLHCSRSVSSFIAVLAFIIVLGGFLYIATYQLLLFSPDIPLLQTRFNEWLTETQHWISKEYNIDSTLQMEYANRTMNEILSNAGNMVSGLLVDVSVIVFWVVIIFIYTYFLLHHRRLILHFIISLFPERNSSKVTSVVMETRSVGNNYLVGLFIEFVVMAVANSTAFAIMNVPYWMLLGILAAVLNFIPYIGIIVGTIIVLLVCMMHGSVMLAFQAGGVLFILHILDANILLPRIVGHKVQMNALVTIISVLIGGAIWGVAGMFLSIPISATLKIIFDHVDGLKPWAVIMGIDDIKAKK
jgi:predicted PurR-regulated permease PerM